MAGFERTEKGVRELMERFVAASLAGDAPTRIHIPDADEAEEL